MNFIQQNSPDGGFLQSEQWRKFQEATGKKTFHVEGASFWANIIEHRLPIVGKYFYIPRGPLGRDGIKEVVDLAKKEKVGWIRVDEMEGIVGNALVHSENRNAKMRSLHIKKSPHDMQPKEIFIIDISKSEEELLAGMKQKTRYNINLAQKKGVAIEIASGKRLGDCLAEFLRLVKITAERQGVNFHAENYYRQMFEVISDENIKLYCAWHNNKVVAANIMIFFGDTVTYLHGASDDKYKSLMAPYLLQWRQIQDAKRLGAKKYDFGGVKVNSKDGKDWAGVTRFKLSFSPSTKPVEFSGSYDIVVCPVKYWSYRFIQKFKTLMK